MSDQEHYTCSVEVMELRDRIAELKEKNHEWMLANERNLQRIAELEQERDYWKGYVQFIDDCMESKELYDEHLRTEESTNV